MTGFSTFTRFSGNTGLWDDHTGLWGGFTGFSASYQAALTLDFLTGTLDSRITFTRAATVATFVGSNGLIQSAATNVPRFDYDPVTLAPRGLLIEGQRANLLLYSDQFDFSPNWLKTNTTVTANATASPDGTTNADKLIGTITAAGHQCQQTAVLTATLGTTYTFSIYLKAAEYGFAFIGINGTAFVAQPYISVNLSSGAVATTNGSPVSSSTQFLGNGWLRVVITGTTDVAVSTVSPDIRPSPDGVWANRNAAQDGTSGIFVWGAQLEVNVFASSYIPTVATTVTRAADSAVMTGTNFSSWFNASEGTFVASASTDSTASARGVYAASDGTNNNRIYLNVTTGAQHLVVASGSTQADITVASSVSNNTIFRDAFAYIQNNAGGATNGVLGPADVPPTTIPVVNQFRLGARGDNTIRLDGRIRSVSYYPQRLPSAQLQALST